MSPTSSFVEIGCVYHSADRQERLECSGCSEDHQQQLADDHECVKQIEATLASLERTTSGPLPIFDVSERRRRGLPVGEKVNLCGCRFGYAFTLGELEKMSAYYQTLDRKMLAARLLCPAEARATWEHGNELAGKSLGGKAESRNVAAAGGEQEDITTGSANDRPGDTAVHIDDKVVCDDSTPDPGGSADLEKGSQEQNKTGSNRQRQGKSRADTLELTLRGSKF